jgi:hypothetical protein
VKPHLNQQAEHSGVHLSTQETHVRRRLAEASNGQKCKVLYGKSLKQKKARCMAQVQTLVSPKKREKRGSDPKHHIQKRVHEDSEEKKGVLS